MADSPDLDARMETVAHRVEFIELLDEEGPLPPRDIVDALSHSRPTVTRALRELREAALVEKHGEGYTTTLPGTMAADEYRRYETVTKAVLSAEDLLTPIPESSAPPAAVLTDGDTFLAQEEVPVRALETVSNRVRQADVVRAYLPTLVNTHLLRAWHRAAVTTSIDSEAIFHPDLLTVLKGQYPHLLAEMAATDGFSAFSTKGPPYGVVLTTTDDTTTVAVMVYEEGTALRGILTNDSTAAVEWARTRLDSLRTDAVEVTADLDALSAAVADGLASPPAPGSSASPPGPSGTAPGRTADGHALPIDLNAEGFVRLSGEYFDTHSQAAPDVGWRTGFTLPEVYSGYAVDRRDAEGRNLTRHLVDTLRTGTDHVVLGPPGSGKSTVCMAVACEWYDRGFGPVLYRERAEDTRFGSPALLEAYLRQSEGHALVVVEDAVRDEANAIFDVMQALDADQSVTFLLDARTHEWHNPETFTLDARLDAYRRTAVEEVTVPGLDEDECDRFVERFTSLVETDLDLTGAGLFEMVEAGTATSRADSLPAGDALVVQHYLSRRYDPSVDTDAAGVTALDEAVRRTYRRLLDAETERAPDLGVLVAALTAAGIPVAREYCYAVADDDEYGSLEVALSLLEGDILFEGESPRNGGSTTYRTHHETWAMRFLEQVLAIEPEQRARERFGRGITRLLALADDPARRERIERHLGGRTPHLHRIEADPRNWADELADRLFSLGRANASLAPLFGATTDDAVALPDACSGWTRLQQAYWRGEMNRTHGDLTRAEREFRTLGELAETVALDEADAAPATPEFTSSPGEGAADVSAHRTRWQATSEIKLGILARARGNYGSAEAHHQDALVRFREIEDKEGEAVSLKNLGTDAFKQADYDRAREYFERSLDIAVEHDARRIEAASLNNLGTVTQQQGDTEQTREYYEESLAISRELGNRSVEAHLLNNLGTIAREQGEYDQAREYHEKSLVIFRELGNRPMEATNFTNLGNTARLDGEYDQAREYFEEGLAIDRDIGNRMGESYTLTYLGMVVRDQGDYDRARKYNEEGLAIDRDIDNRSGEGYDLLYLGVIDRKQGKYDRAREYLEGSLAIFRDLEVRHGEAPSLTQLGAVAREQGDYDRARDYFEQARAAFEAIGDAEGIAELQLEQGRLALAQDDPDREELLDAKETVLDACETVEALERPHKLARCRLVLGRLAAATDAPAEACEHWGAALETFDEVGAPQDVLTTLRCLVETCREQGETERAREWYQQARDVLSEAPESTAALHRDWIERSATEPAEE